jgi:hypothetical protein
MRRCTQAKLSPQEQSQWLSVSRRRKQFEENTSGYKELHNDISEIFVYHFPWDQITPGIIKQISEYSSPKYNFLVFFSPHWLGVACLTSNVGMMILYCAERNS